MPLEDIIKNILLPPIPQAGGEKVFFTYNNIKTGKCETALTRYFSYTAKTASSARFAALFHSNGIIKQNRGIKKDYVIRIFKIHKSPEGTRSYISDVNYRDF